MDRQAIIVALKSNMQAAEAILAAVPADSHVIEWEEFILRTDGSEVAIIGPKIYHGTAAMMRFECRRWNMNKPENTGKAVAMPAAEALARMQSRHADLLAAMDKAGK